MKNSAIILILLTAFLFSSTAMTQPYVRHNNEAQRQSDNALPIVPQSSATPRSQKLLIPTQPDSMGKFAGNYFDNCMSKENQILKGELLKKLCACSATKLAEAMTVADVKIMAENTPEGQKMRNRMLLQVYAPCIEYPTQALLENKCAGDPEIQKQIPNYQQACSCMAQSMGQYMAENGQTAISRSIVQNPDDPDPLRGLMNSPEFQAEAQSRLAGCLGSALTGTP